ncbi:C5a anaphylatoxin chemotactic receptor 1-like [Gastrophryne carolinensis]
MDDWEEYNSYYEDSSKPLETTASASPHPILPIDWVAIIMYSIVFLVGVPGNGLVVWVSTFEMKRTVNTAWFVNLAVADLLCCFSVPFSIMSMILGQWPLGQFACKFIPSILMVNMYASVFLLTAISVDRCVLVLKPVWCHNNRTVTKAYLACLVIWILAFILSTPAFLFRHVQQYRDGKTLCSYVYVLAGDHKQLVENIIAISRCLIAFVFPFLIITICYSLLMKRVSQRFGESKKTLKLILIVITAFFVCWLPYHIASLILAMNTPSALIFQYTDMVDSMLIVLAFFNSCINPVIYVLVGHKIRSKDKRSIKVNVKNALVEYTSEPGSSNRTKSTSESKILEEAV